MVEVADRPPPKPSRDRLEDTSVQAHRMATGAKREPEEVTPGVDARLREETFTSQAGVR